MRISQREIDLSSFLMARDRLCNELIRAQGELLAKLQAALALIEEMKKSNDSLVNRITELAELPIPSFRKDEV